MKKTIAVLLAVLSMVTLFAACTGNAGQNNTTSTPTSGNTSQNSQNNDITASGSTALQPLLTLAVDPFKATGYTGSITINGGGSGQGLTDVASGTVSIGNSDVTPEQAGKDGTGLVDNQVCVVAVGIAVSKDVKAALSDISSADLAGIFTGAITDWNQVKGWTGGSLPIQVLYRKAGSGTRTLFETYGTNKKLSDAELGAFENFTKKESSGDLESAISSGTGAIGYETLPYCKNLDLLKLDGVEATYDNVYTGAYKIWGFEHMYTKGAPQGSVKAFIDFVKSPDFEQTILDKGYGLSSRMQASH